MATNKLWKAVCDVILDSTFREIDLAEFRTALVSSSHAERHQLLDAMRYLVEVGQEIASQDNRMTAVPIHIVMDGDHARPVAYFFTNLAATAYLEANRHNYPDRYVYVGSNYHSSEYENIRNILMQLARR